jgi:hypothetical protein
MQLTIISLVSVVTTLFTVGIILGLSVYIGDRLKDTSVNSSTMVVKGTNTPVQVASSDFQVGSALLPTPDINVERSPPPGAAFQVINGSLVARAANSSDSSSPLITSTQMQHYVDCPISWT